MTDYTKMTKSQLNELCKERRISNYSKLNKQGVIDLLTAAELPTVKNQRIQNVKDVPPVKIEMSKIPEWYKIPEILPSDFVKCCTDIFTLLEGKHESKSTEDPFLKAVMMGQYGMTEAEWHTAEQVRLKQKVLEMKMGDFHEELMGKFSGYQTLPNGHSTGCDVQKNDETVIFEVKNRDNTVKGSDGKHIITLLKKHKDTGKKAIFAQIICPGGKVNRYGASSDIDVWNGNQTYAYLSGRESFFSDLLITVQYTFSNYKTFKDLKGALGIA
jgi:hypothetical protein